MFLAQAATDSELQFLEGFNCNDIPVLRDLCAWIDAIADCVDEDGC